MPLYLYFIISLFITISCPSLSRATNYPFNENVNLRIGIGTTQPASAALVVMQGNVGIGSLNPGQILDVAGTVSAKYFSGNGSGLTNVNGSINSLTANYIPMASSPTALTISNIYQTGGNVGINIGATSPVQTLEVNGGLQVDGSGLTNFTGGNVGIGTAKPSYTLDVNGDIGDSAGGGIGIQDQGGSVYTSYNTLDDGSGNATLVGNVGIGSYYPVAELDVNGTVRMTTFMLTTSPSSGFVLTSDANGYGTWASAGTIGAFTIVSVNTTLDNTYYLVYVDLSVHNAAIAITLPTAVGIAGRCYRIKDGAGESATYNITIGTSSSQKIDGASILVINANYQAYDVCSNGSNWSIF
ncbi:MAG: hypothetical protein HQL14_02685 [Candidatus Omnitrophica bacterium]|nr:hypothetical protein [Candidatus Omnitrophota bacterium]